MRNIVFSNRKEAGQLLAEKLQHYGGSETIVLGIPRGGMPVAYEIAKKLGAKLDIVLAKKIGHPFNPEFAIGSVSPDTVIIDTHENISESYIKQKITDIRAVLNEKNKLYRGNKPPLHLKGKQIIIADDGIATGNTLLASIAMLRKQKVGKIIVASPVVPTDRVSVIEEAADEFIYLQSADDFPGVGAFYENFEQVSDEEVKQLLLL